MAEASLARRVMAGRDSWTLPVRGLLRLCSVGYRAAIVRRNRRYDRGVLNPGITFLPKPFSVNDLIQKVHQVLSPSDEENP